MQQDAHVQAYKTEQFSIWWYDTITEDDYSYEIPTDIPF